MAAKKPSSNSFRMPLLLGVLRGDDVVQAELNFASGDDIQAAKKWRVSPRLAKTPHMRHRATEACELAQLAAKRWRYYRDSRTFASSFEQLRSLIAEDSHGEFSFHLKVTADWFPEIMGGAMIRRTWCHHLMIDFLFVHPDICSRLAAIKMVGVQILQARLRALLSVSAWPEGGRPLHHRKAGDQTPRCSCGRSHTRRLNHADR